MHVEDSIIQAYLHDELEASESSIVRAHLDACDRCRGLVEDAARDEADLHVLLAQLDHAPPDIVAHTVIAEARARRFARLRWAAGIMLIGLGAAGAAYAAPGSPVRGWLDGLFGDAGASVAAPAAGTSDAGPAAPTPFGGIEVSPGSDLSVVFTTLASSSTITVSLHDGPRVEVRALGGSATFNDEVDGRLVIDEIDPAASFEVLIPHSAPRVEVRVGERRALLKDGDRVVAETESDARGVRGGGGRGGGGSPAAPLTPPRRALAPPPAPTASPRS